MMWIVYIGLILFGLFLKDSKPYAVAVVLFMGILAWNNTDAADYYTIYWLPYQNLEAWTGLEPGWRALCQLGGALGLSYNGFACLIALLSTALLYFFAKGTGINTSYFLALFLVYPGPMSLVQFRQFFASAIVAAGMLLLLKKGWIKYLLFAIVVLLAFTVHRSSLLMLSFALLPLAYRVEKRGRFLLGIIALVAAVFVVLNAESFSTYFFGEFKTVAYLQQVDSASQAASSMGGLRNVVYLIGFAALAAYLFSLATQDSLGASALLGENRDLWLAVIGGNLAMLLLVPFATISNDFMRFQRYTFTYTNALFALMPGLAKRHPIFSCKALYIAVCLAFAYPFVIAGTLDTVYVPLLSIESFPSLFA